MPIVTAPSLDAPIPQIRVIRPYRAAPAFTSGGRRVLLLGARPGAALRAPCTGSVAFHGRVAGGQPSVTLRCRSGERVTLSRVAAPLSRGVATRSGSVLARAAGPRIGISVRRPGLGYVDPLPLLRGGGSARPPVAPVVVPRVRAPRLPTVRLERPVRIVQAPVSSPASVARPGVDRWVGGLGSVLGLSGLGWWLVARRRGLATRAARGAVHPAGPRR